jgi:hypothetical protein
MFSTRRLLLAVLFIGILGTGLELVLLEHYENPWQLVPLVLLAAGTFVLIWHAARPGKASAIVLRTTMSLFLAAGILGVGLHYRANVEFQLELDPDQSRTDIFWKAIRAKAPPALAPGVMVQLGLLGLIYGYAGPAAGGSGGRVAAGQGEER